MVDEVETEEQRESRYLGSQLQMNCGVLTPIVEYCIGANSYRQRQAVQRRSQSDIIMDFVVMNPNKALRFLRSAIICGILMNACVYLTENFLCAYAYPRKITLNRDIWWLVMIMKEIHSSQVANGQQNSAGFASAFTCFLPIYFKKTPRPKHPGNHVLHVNTDNLSNVALDQISLRCQLHMVWYWFCLHE